MSDTRSGTYDYNPPEYQIISGALRLLGAIQSGETAPAEEYEDARAALNGVVKAWQANQIHVWAQYTVVVPLQVGKEFYTIGIGASDLGSTPRPLRVTAAQLVIADEWTPLIEMTRLDYMQMSNKNLDPGTPAQWFYNAQIPYGVLALWPPPDAAVVGVQAYVSLVALRPLQVFDTQRNTMDLPQEWVSALRFALAVELAPEYDCPVDRFKIIKSLADEKLTSVKAWDVEPQGTSTLPFSQQVYQLIAGALRLCGAGGAQELLQLGLINNGFYALNNMVRAWQGAGIRVWTQTDAMLFLQPGQTEYELGDNPPTDHCTYSNEVVQLELMTEAAAGATTLTVNDVSRIAPEFKLGIWLDHGFMFWTHVQSTAGNVITITDPMPAEASGGAMLACYQNDLVRPLKMPAARRYIWSVLGGTPIEIPLGMMSRIDYANIPTKAVPNAVPTQIYFEPTLQWSRVHIWPPMQAGQKNAVKMTVQLPLATFADLTAITNFPDEWMDALRFNLALNLWPEHAERRAAIKGDWNLQLLTAQATDKLATAMSWDREPESIYFGLQSFPSTRN